MAHKEAFSTAAKNVTPLNFRFCKINEHAQNQTKAFSSLFWSLLLYDFYNSGLISLPLSSKETERAVAMKRKM